MSRYRFTIMLSSLLALLLSGCPEAEEELEQMPAPSNRLVDILQTDPQFAAFYAQLDAETIAELSAREAGTVFAPTNAAMATVADLCFTRWQIAASSDDPGDGEPLRLFTRFHIDFDSVTLTRENLVAIGELEDGVLAMLMGGDARLETGEGGEVTVAGRSIGQPIMADNGYIHPIVDAAMLPAALVDPVAAGCAD